MYYNKKAKNIILFITIFVMIILLLVAVIFYLKMESIISTRNYGNFSLVNSKRDNITIPKSSKNHFCMGGR